VDDERRMLGLWWLGATHIRPTSRPRRVAPRRSRRPLPSAIRVGHHPCAHRDVPVPPDDMDGSVVIPSRPSWEIAGDAPPRSAPTSAQPVGDRVRVAVRHPVERDLASIRVIRRRAADHPWRTLSRPRTGQLAAH
jgi:hypothetical protein